jgi:hypothetical protein
VSKTELTGIRSASLAYPFGPDVELSILFHRLFDVLGSTVAAKAALGILDLI